MSALTAPRVVQQSRGTVKKLVLPLAVGAKAWEGGMACLDTAAPGALKQGQAGVSTLLPLGQFTQSVDNSAGGATVPVGVDLTDEKTLEYWDSVTGAGAITSANLLQEVYIASDHELTTVSSGNAPYGYVWQVRPLGYQNGPGIGVAPLVGG